METILSSKEIKTICKELADKLYDKFKSSKTIPVFICVLKGANPFFIDLTRAYKGPLIYDYMQLSSYSGTSTTGVIHLSKDLTENIKGKDVVIVEDVVDTGLTLSYVKEYIKIKYMPKSITVVCLIDKKALRRVEFEPDYSGFVIRENKFLMGYGLDYKEIGRNFDFVFVPDKKTVEKWEEMLKNNK